MIPRLLCRVLTAGMHKFKVMKSNLINEQIRYVYTSKETHDDFSVIVSDEELVPGFSDVVLQYHDSTIEVSLQDVPGVMELLQRVVSKVVVYTDLDFFEKNKEKMRVVLGESWVDLFQHYHDRVKEAKIHSV